MEKLEKLHISYENPQENGDTLESQNSEGNEYILKDKVFDLNKLKDDLIDLDLNSPEFGDDR